MSRNQSQSSGSVMHVRSIHKGVCHGCIIQAASHLRRLSQHVELYTWILGQSALEASAAAPPVDHIADAVFCRSRPAVPVWHRALSWHSLYAHPAALADHAACCQRDWYASHWQQALRHGVFAKLRHWPRCRSPPPGGNGRLQARPRNSPLVRVGFRLCLKCAS